MKVQFAEIPPEGLQLSIRDESWFPDDEVNHAGPVVAELFLERLGEQRVLLSGSVTTVLTPTCDRCLASYQEDFAGRFRVDLEVAGQLSLAAEHGCSREEMDTIFLEEPVIDLHQMLAQQVLLALPVKKLCRQDCRGLCPRCGIDLNTDICACGDDHGSSPFGVLAGLKH